MIATLTPNPSLDRTLSVERLEPGGVMRASRVRVECSGKGVNVARALGRNQQAARAVFPANADDAAVFVSSLAADGAAALPVPARGTIRSCFTLVEPDGTATQINEPGPEMSASEADELVSQAAAASADSDWMVASGSLPPGAPDDLYARLAAMLPDAGARLAVDTSGAALDALVGAACAVVKPNLAELAAVIGSSLSTVADVIDAADKFRRSGWRSVLVSLGRDGAVLVADEVCCGTVAGVEVRNTVGAGDALLAGFVSAGGRGAAALAEGLAWASAAIRSTDTLGQAVTDRDRRTVQLSADRCPDRRVGAPA